MCTSMRVIIYTWHTIYMHGFFQTPARSYLTCLEGLSLCIFKSHIFTQYILINVSTSASRSVRPFVVVCVCVCARVCVFGQSSMYNDTRTVLGQPRERKPITTVREREGQRIPQYPTERRVVIDLFFFFSFSPLFLFLDSLYVPS